MATDAAGSDRPRGLPEDNPSNVSRAVLEDRKARGHGTVGEEALKLQGKTDDKVNPIDLQREIAKGSKSEEGWEAQLWECIDRGRKMFEGDFHVVMLFKKERLLHNVVRQYFIPRKTCPSPEYDQSVWRYRRSSDEAEYLWTIPDHSTCAMLLQNRIRIVQEEQWLVDIVDKFSSGLLDIQAHNINVEMGYP